MRWSDKSIEEAIVDAKTNNKIFVVYVEDATNVSRFNDVIRSSEVSNLLSRDEFIAVRILSSSQTYRDFSTIYHLVPVPSLFFIGRNGWPLEIISGQLLQHDVVQRIQNVLTHLEQSFPSSASGQSLTNDPTSSQITPELSIHAHSDNPVLKASASPLGSDPSPPGPSRARPTVPTTAASRVELSSSDSNNTVIANDGVSSKTATFPHPATQESDVQQHGLECQSLSSDSYGVSSMTSIEPLSSPSDNYYSRSLSSHSSEGAIAPISQIPAKNSSIPGDNPSVNTSNRHRSVLEGNIVARSQDGYIQNLTNNTDTTLPTSEDPTSEQVQDISERGVTPEANAVANAENEIENGETDDNDSISIYTTSVTYDHQLGGSHCKDALLMNRKQVSDSKQTGGTSSTTQSQNFLTTFGDLSRMFLGRDNSSNFKASSDQTSCLGEDQLGTQATDAPSKEASHMNAHLQFRLPDGSTHSHVFSANASVGDVLNYVRNNIRLPCRDFVLATSYPRLEFTQEHVGNTLAALGLVPRSVILVIPSSEILRPSAYSAVFGTLWSLVYWPFSSLYSLFTYLHFWIFGGTDPSLSQSQVPQGLRNTQQNVPAASAEQVPSGNNLMGARRRTTTSSTVRDGNVYRLSNRQEDSDDDNNTWNGNSTQQM